VLDWRPLGLEDRRVVCDYLRNHPPRISELTFTNLFVWRGHRPIRWAERDGALFLLQERDGHESLLGYPVGGGPVEEWLPVLSESGVRTFERVPRGVARKLCKAGLKSMADRANADYVYRRLDLVELAGRRYHRQKNLVNRCLSRYRCSYCDLTPDLLPEVREMQERWCDERPARRDPGLCAERRAIAETFDRYEELGLRGGAVRVDGRVEAYCAGEALSPDTAVVHFEKAMASFQGLYQVINRWFCEFGLAGFEFVNREQDLGLPGLRRAKRSYHPHHMVHKCIAGWPGEVLERVPAEQSGRCCEEMM
jgi:hypothetical protein